MNKISGKQSDFSLIREDNSRIIIGYDIKQIKDTDMYEWYEVYIPKKHKSNITFQDIKDVILADIDLQTDEKILTGYVWNIPNEEIQANVWLSSENQFNYKAAFDLAVQTNGQNLPVVFKFGAPENPIYHTFSELSELQSFYIGAVSYINLTLAEGWQRKDAIDWAPYEALFTKE